MKKLFLILSYTLLFIAVAFAQDNENKLEKLKNTLQNETLRISGYGQIQYNYNEYPKRSMTSANANSSIDIMRAVVIASGKLGNSDRIEYTAAIDLGPNPRLLELYADWFSSKALNIRFGQFKIPFTIENPLSVSRIETVNFARSVSAMSGSTGDFNQWEPDGRIASKTGRDAGLRVSGFLFPVDNFYRLEYHTGFFNGAGMNTKDNNNFKDFIGTAYLYPDKQLKLGGSFYVGKYPQYMEKHLLGHSLVNRRWTVGAEFKGDHLYSRTEYMSSNDGGRKRNGYYGLLIWKYIPDQWEIIGKYDYYNKDTLSDNDAIRDITLGFNYYFAYLSRIQFNYVYSDYQFIGKNNAVAVQFQVFF
jgi:hypothetical protein